MYTRCPSCRAEISFEPPANASNLPDGYKHKIKCPSCGVTIGVKIPKVTSDIQPTFVPQNPNAVPSEPVVNAAPVVQQTEKAVATKKVYGKARNTVMIVLSAVIAVICAFGYLVNNGDLNFNGSAGLGIFDGISPILSLFKGNVPEGDILECIIPLLPSITLVFAVINFIVAITSLFVGKYFKTYNVIAGLLLAAASVSTCFTEFFLSRLTNVVETLGFLEFIQGTLIGEEKYLVFVGALFGLAIFACSIAFCFIKNEKKPKAE